MEETGSARAGGVKFRVLVVATIGAGIVFLDTSVASVALPAIQRDLGLTTSLLQWVASAYLLTLSILLLAGGRLADIFGRRRMFLSGLALYALLAAAAGLSPNGAVLIAVRALQGAAGAVLVPTTLALINATYPPEERGAAIGAWAGWSGIATVLGQVLGGVVITYVLWRYAFLISPALAVVTLLLARAIPESRDEQAEKVLDGTGILLCCLGLGGPVFALIEGPIAGWDSMSVLAGLALGVVLVPAFVWWESRAAHPMLPFAMFESRDLRAANVVTLFVYAGLYGTFFYVNLYVQTALGQTALIASTLFIPVTAILFVLSPLAGRLNDRYGPRWLLCFGPLTSAAGLVVASLTGPGQLLSVLTPGIVIMAIGLGFTVAPVTATAIGAAEERYSGVASGFNNAVARVAGLLAIAAMGVIVVQLWQGAVASAGAAVPVARPALAAVSQKVFVAPDTSGMPAALSAEVKRLALEAARRSYRDGMLLAAFLVACGGVVSAAFIRGTGRGAAAEVAPAGAAGGYSGSDQAAK